MTVLKTQAHAKINLCLFVGPKRGDGHHEVVTLMDTLDLCDDVRMDTDSAGVTADEVVCPGVEGPNLAADALRVFRERTGWNGPPVRLEIDKRIPVAGGMAGGSADAAAALRLAAEASGLGDRRLLEDIANSARRRRRQPDPRRARAGDRHRRPAAAAQPARSPTASSSSRSTASCRPATSTRRPTGSACPARRSTSLAR